MKFIDEASIHVQAGRGGDGCLSMLRRRNLPKGGPDGGNGGDGGHVFLVADLSLNTLVDFRHRRHYRACPGQPGGSRQMTGRSGDDLHLQVPVGTTVLDEETRETLGDLVQAEQRLMVARGGAHGLGNSCFKSSVNRAPRRTTTGGAGESRHLCLQLRLLADVGLLGLPNAGKSSLLAAVSAARPQIADYPFTTLIPNLGVVSVDEGRSFVMADVPGLIAGAATGAGLGTRFLRHLSRTRLLLHLVDMLPVDGADPVAAVNIIDRELDACGGSLTACPKWLVLSKMDLLPASERAGVLQHIRRAHPHYGVVHMVSAATGEGVKALVHALASALADLPPAPRAAVDTPNEVTGDMPHDMPHSAG